MLKNLAFCIVLFLGFIFAPYNAMAQQTPFGVVSLEEDDTKIEMSFQLAQAALSLKVSQRFLALPASCSAYLNLILRQDGVILYPADGVVLGEGCEKSQKTTVAFHYVGDVASVEGKRAWLQALGSWLEERGITALFFLPEPGSGADAGVAMRLVFLRSPKTQDP